MSKPAPIPPGFHSITPSLIVKDPDAAMKHYQKAFGAEELMCMRGPNGCVMHAEMKFGDSIVMMSGEWPDHGMVAPTPGRSSGGLHLYVNDADAAFKRAVDAGCTALMPPTNMFWGDRYAKVLDSYGHQWGLATRVEEVSPEECERRAAAWKPC